MKMVIPLDLCNEMLELAETLQFTLLAEAPRLVSPLLPLDLHWASFASSVAPCPVVHSIQRGFLDLPWLQGIGKIIGFIGLETS
jgi:hypothetical protein